MTVTLTHSKWITRERPKIDRIACPWLVLRFIDPKAEFLYVSADQVLAQRGARGDACLAAGDGGVIAG